MSESTREMARPKSARWLYRTERGDFGPVSTDEILDAIKAREVDLRTEVKQLGATAWGVAADERMFRDQYGICRAQWERQELHAETERLGTRLRRSQTRRKGAWIFMAVGTVVVVSAAALLWWRLSRAEPMGVSRLFSATDVGSLPAFAARSAEPVGYPVQTARRQAVLPEPELLDTAGIRVGGPGTPETQRFEFDESGEVAEIPPAVLAAVTEGARQGLVQCARQLATSSASFSGTEVAFSVASGRITKISVGNEVAGSAVFRACVKTALARVSVPTFAAGPRRVTVPLRVGR